MTHRPFGTALRRWLHGMSEPTAADLADGPLLERFVRQRDEAAFETLVQRHGPLVLGVCRNVLRDRHDAEDAFQATFLVLACRAAAIRRTESVASFLYGTACRIARRLRAQNARRHALHRQAATRLPDVSSPDSGDPDACAVLHEELNRLPRKYRDVLVLCYPQSKTNEQAARELGYPPGSMSRHLNRARELLRERLLHRGANAWAALVGPALAERATATASPRLVRATAQIVRRHALPVDRPGRRRRRSRLSRRRHDDR